MNEAKISELQVTARAIRTEIAEKMARFENAEKSGDIEKCKKMAPAISELRNQLQDTAHEIGNLDFPNRMKHIYELAVMGGLIKIRR